MKPAKSVASAAPPVGLALPAFAADFARAPTSAASRRSISALAPTGLGRKSTAPYFIALTAAPSELLALIAMSGAVMSDTDAAPPRVSMSASTMASPDASALRASADVAHAVAMNRPLLLWAMMPLSARRWAGSASTTTTLNGPDDGHELAMSSSDPRSTGRHESFSDGP